MRAQRHHQATVVSLSGDIDAANADRAHGFVSRFLLVGDAVVLDLSGVEFFSARGISVLLAVDAACRTAGVPWALVGSNVVSRVLRLTNCDSSLPLASSVPEALRQVSGLTQEDRRRSDLAPAQAQCSSQRRRWNSQ